MIIDHYEACERDWRLVFDMLGHVPEDESFEDARKWTAFGSLATQFLHAAERRLIEAILLWGKPGDRAHSVCTGDTVYSAVNLEPDDPESQHQLIMVHLHDTEFFDTMI